MSKQPRTDERRDWGVGLSVVFFVAFGLVACGPQKAADTNPAEVPALSDGPSSQTDVESTSEGVAPAEPSETETLLAEREEALRRQEEELQQREEQLARAEELRQREEALRQKERELATRERRVANEESELAARHGEVSARPLPESPRAVETTPSAAFVPDSVDVGDDVAERSPEVEVASYEESSDWRQRRHERVPVGEEPPQSPSPRKVADLLRPGTRFEVEVLEPLSSRTSQVGDTFKTRLSHAVMAEDGSILVPAGSELYGVVVESRPLRRVGGQAALGFEIQRLALPSGDSLEIRASFLELGKNQKKDKAKIAGAAVVGAILGSLVGDDEAALAGAALGAAAGTAAVLESKGRDIELPEGTVLELELQEVVSVRSTYGGVARP